MATESPKDPAEPISAGLAPLYALARKFTAVAEQWEDADTSVGHEIYRAYMACATQLEAGLTDVSTDLNFKINNWQGQQANEAEKQRRIRAALVTIVSIQPTLMEQYREMLRDILIRVAG